MKWPIFWGKHKWQKLTQVEQTGLGRVFPTVIFSRTLQHLAFKHILSRSHSCPATLVNASQAQPSLTTRLPSPPISGLTTDLSGSNKESALYSFAFPSLGAQMMNRGQGRYIFLINWGCNRSRFLVVTASPIHAIQEDPTSGWCLYSPSRDARHVENLALAQTFSGQYSYCLQGCTP